jgi:hypothetical protein
MVLKLWRTETILFLGIWLVLMFLGREKFCNDPGSPWHLVVGRCLLSFGELLDSDPVSFTFAGKPWITPWSLGECVLALMAMGTYLLIVVRQVLLPRQHSGFPQA